MLTVRADVQSAVEQWRIAMLCGGGERSVEERRAVESRRKVKVQAQYDDVQH